MRNCGLAAALAHGATLSGDPLTPSAFDHRDSLLAVAVEQQSDPGSAYDGRPLAEWLDVMKSLEFRSRSAAEAVPGLLEIVRDEQLPWYTRRQAALTLGRIGEAAQGAIPVLEALLASPSAAEDSSTAAWAAKALSLFGTRAAPATPTLVRVLEDDERPLLVRLSCVDALSRIGGAHSGAIPALIRLAELEPVDALIGPELQVAAVDGLAFAGSAASPAVPTLIHLSRSDSARLRRVSATALGNIGLAAGIATQALAELVLFDESPDVRTAAAAALATIGDPGQAALRKLLTAEDPAVRLAAAAACEHIDRPAEPTTSALRRSLGDSEPIVRIAAAKSLWKLTAEGEPLVPTLLGALTHEDRQLRIGAYRLLIDISPTSEAVLEELRRLSQDVHPEVRQVAENALRRLAASQERSAVHAP